LTAVPASRCNQKPETASVNWRTAGLPEEIWPLQNACSRLRMTDRDL
jgi:hypothetical protein